MNKNNSLKIINIILLYILVVLLSSPFNSGLVSEEYMTFTKGTYLEYWSYLPAAFGTCLIALLFYRLDKINVRKMTLLGNNPLKNIIFSIIPIIVFSITGIENYYNEDIYSFGLIYCILNFIYAVGEEICWRGYLNDSLSFVNKYFKYSLTGILWWAWHLRFSNAFELLIFPIFCIMASFFMGAIADKTKSYLTAGGIHLFLMILTSNSSLTTHKLTIASFVILFWIMIKFVWFVVKLKNKPKILIRK